MPTILLLLGWRLFFYANEGGEPIHVHAKKGDMECKFWLDVESFDITLGVIVQHDTTSDEGSQKNHL